MNTIQQLATIALVAMAIYIVFVHLTKKSAIPIPDLVMPGSQSQQNQDNPNVLKNDTQGVMQGVSLGPPPGGFQIAPASAMFNPDAKGVLPYNHDKFEQKAEFQSDLTNMNQFYKNNPELFRKAGMDVSWTEKSDAMHQSHLTAQSAWIGAANQDITVGSPL